jgi:hypothetical protein
MATFTPFSYPLPTWKALLQPTPAGGNYTITAVCTGCASNTTTLTLSNAVFGDIWVCAGQSNAMLWVSHSFGRNESAAAYAKGGQNIRVMGGQDTNYPYATWPPAYARGYPGANGKQVGASNPWMTYAEAVPAGCIDAQNCPLFGTSGACWFALQHAADAGVDVPLGLVALTLGGQRIEEFMSVRLQAPPLHLRPRANERHELSPARDGAYFFARNTFHPADPSHATTDANFNTFYPADPSHATTDANFCCRM